MVCFNDLSDDEGKIINFGVFSHIEPNLFTFEVKRGLIVLYLIFTFG